jgi:hypothetical protein
MTPAVHLRQSGWMVRAIPETSHSFSLLSAADPTRLRSILIVSGPLLTQPGHFFTESPTSGKASSPDHLVKNRLISSKNRAVAGSCFRKR